VNNEFPVYNGIVPSWCDIIVRVTATGAPLLSMPGIKSINSGVEGEVGDKRGASGGRVVGRTTGSVSNTAAMTLYRDEFQLFLRNLATAAKSLGYVRGNQVLVGLVHFGIQIQHTPPGSVEIYEQRIKGCRYMGRDLNGAEGNDADAVDVKLNPLEVVDMIDGNEIVLL
jgi:hypothetical protein